MNPQRTLAFIRRRLGKLATQPLERHLLDSIVEASLKSALSPDTISIACKYLEENVLRPINLSGSKIPLAHIGERSSEWEFFQRRKDALPADPAAYVSRHKEVGKQILHNISGSIYSRQEPGKTYQIFMRHKSTYSARRKMRSKRLRSWEVGDYLAFAICPLNLWEMKRLVDYFDIAYASEILYKQNGFADRLVYRREVSGFPGRRVFYIIRFDDSICFEVQIVTLRQLIFLHVDHARYIGKPHSVNELKSLEMFGNQAYLLDLLDLIPEPEKDALLQFLRQSTSFLKQNTN